LAESISDFLSLAGVCTKKKPNQGKAKKETSIRPKRETRVGGQVEAVGLQGGRFPTQEGKNRLGVGRERQWSN